jgi:hypothetical protein
MSDHGGTVRILDFEPVPGSTGLIGLREALGHDALKPHEADLFNYRLAGSCSK